MILAALLLPALSQAKETAYKIVCMNNLAQAMKIRTQYSADWDDRQYLTGQLPSNPNNSKWPTALILGGYTPQFAEWMSCPREFPFDMTAPGQGHPDRGYAWNWTYYNDPDLVTFERTLPTSAGDRTSTYYSLASQPDLSRMSMVMDSIGWSANPFAFATFPYNWRQPSGLSINGLTLDTASRVGVRHVGTANLGFLDCHVESWDKYKLVEKGRLWNGTVVPIWVGGNGKYSGFGL